MNPLTKLVTKLGASSGALAKTTLLAAALVGGTLLTGGEAKAQVGGPFSCTFGTTGSTCGSSTPWQIDDKKFTFGSISGTYNNSITPTPVSGEIFFTKINDVWDVLVSFPGVGYSDTTGTFTYTLEVVGSPDSIVAARLDSDVAVSTLSIASVIKTINATEVLTSIDGLPAPGPAGNDFLSIGPYTKISVVDKWSACPLCQIRNFNNGYKQTVPGPLPVLGAAAAFGYSRRLRSRIRLNRPEARIEA